MTLRVSERSPGRVVFAVVADTTLARWMDLRRATFDWRSGDLKLTLGYRRTFDPGWYFGPLQHYAVSEAAGYLATTFTCMNDPTLIRGVALFVPMAAVWIAAAVRRPGEREIAAMILATASICSPSRS